MRRPRGCVKGLGAAVSQLALSLQFLQAQPDRRLIALAREGHEAAFEALVRRYRKELLAYCRRLQPTSGSAEDALQQTLLQAWRALKAGAEVRDARPWLYRIAHNASLNQLRVTIALPQEVSEAVGGPEVHQLVEQRLQARAALAGMASLPGLQRDVLVSTTLNGASHEEVARALGLSSGAVRGLIYRARATLRSAATTLTPSPVLHWAIRRGESGTGGAPAITEAVVGGGGAGVVAAIAKGWAVLTLAGAVAGAGGVIMPHSAAHHRRPVARPAGPSARVHARATVVRVGPRADELATAFARRAANGSLSDHPGHRAASERGRDFGSVGEDHRGSRGGSTGQPGGGSRGGSDGAPSTGSTGGSDGGSLAGVTASSDGSSKGSSGGPSGSSSGGSSGPSSGSTSTTSGSDGGTSGGPGPSGGSTSTTSGPDGGTSGGPGPSSSAQLSTARMTSDGGSGSDGGPTGTSGSGETTTSSH